jgi:hypothetical protein
MNCQACFMSNTVHLYRGAAPSRNILYPDGDDVTAAKLAVDRQIEQGKVSHTTFDLQLGPDCPDVFGRSGGFAPVSLPLFQGTRLGDVEAAITSSCIADDLASGEGAQLSHSGIFARRRPVSISARWSGLGQPLSEIPNLAECARLGLGRG